GRTEAGETLAAMLVADFLEAGCGGVQRLFPCRLAEMRPRVAGIGRIMRILLHARFTDHRLGQALRMADIVEAEAALDAEPVLVRRAGAAVDIEQLVVLDL